MKCFQPKYYKLFAISPLALVRHSSIRLLFVAALARVNTHSMPFVLPYLCSCSTSGCCRMNSKTDEKKMFSCFFVVVVGDIMKLTMLNTRFMKIHFRPLLCHSIVEHISHNIRFHVRLCQLLYLESGSTCSTLYARSPFCVQRRHGERETMKQLSNCLTCRDGPCSPVPLRTITTFIAD